jgi:hypothetical protein
MKNKMEFRVYFNKGRQFFDVFISDSSRKFMREHKCWAYYQPAEDRYARRGYFGSIHLSREGVGLVSHELLHLWIDWIRARKPGIINNQNEERLVTEFGEMSRHFWKKYYDHEKMTTI